MGDPFIREAAREWDRRSKKAEDFEMQVRQQEDIERASLTIGDVGEFIDWLTEDERKELLEAYKKEHWLDIGHYHGLASDRYVKFFAEKKVSEAIADQDDEEDDDDDELYDLVSRK